MLRVSTLLSTSDRRCAKLDCPVASRCFSSTRLMKAWLLLQLGDLLISVMLCLCPSRRKQGSQRSQSSQSQQVNLGPLMASSSPHSLQKYPQWMLSHWFFRSASLTFVPSPPSLSRTRKFPPDCRSRATSTSQDLGLAGAGSYQALRPSLNSMTNQKNFIRALSLAQGLGANPPSKLGTSSWVRLIVGLRATCLWWVVEGSLILQGRSSHMEELAYVVQEFLSLSLLQPTGVGGVWAVAGEGSAAEFSTGSPGNGLESGDWRGRSKSAAVEKGRARRGWAGGWREKECGGEQVDINYKGEGAGPA